MHSSLTTKLRDRLTRKITREYLDDFIATQATAELVLDVGCAHSPYAKYFPKRIALDLVKRERAHLDVIADVCHLPFKSASLPTVMLTEVLSALREPQRAIDEIERILKPGGKLILTTRFIFPLCDTPHDFYRFTKYGLQHLLRRWAEVHIKSEASFPESLAILAQRIAFQSDFPAARVSRLLLLLLARLLKWSGPLLTLCLREQYGDLSRRYREEHLLTSGYYVLATKKP